jgi:AraC family transcriptional regulator
MVGCSVMTYVRKRRLSNALYDLVTTNRSIIDIAFEYGYESHEAFTRMFKTAYGAPPRQIRKAQTEPLLFERINLLTEIKGELIMKPEIICKDALTIIALKKYVSGIEETKYELLTETKKSLIANLDKINSRVGDLFYAAYDYKPEDMDKDDDDITYTYYYGVEVSEDSKAPDGMVKKTLPQGRYAVFTYDLNNNTLNGMALEEDIYDYIDGVWLPASGFELSDQSDYEVINKAKNQIDYYISIK